MESPTPSLDTFLTACSRLLTCSRPLMSSSSSQVVYERIIINCRRINYAFAGSNWISSSMFGLDSVSISLNNRNAQEAPTLESNPPLLWLCLSELYRPSSCFAEWKPKWKISALTRRSVFARGRASVAVREESSTGFLDALALSQSYGRGSPEFRSIFICLFLHLSGVC